jgi:tetraacyldisaccharide 4'-kinase
MKLLLPFAWLYALAIMLRNKLFDWGVLRSESVGVPVISVGNLTVGGTGKTPLVEFVVRLLIEKKKRVAVVSRGYKRKSSGVVVVADGKRVFVDADAGGDEAVQIAMKFREAIVVVGEQRVDAARKAVELGAEVIVLDDGFQHRYLKRELDIVVVDSTNDISRDAVLPAGRLREPVSGLKRASVVAFSKFDETIVGQFNLDEKLDAKFSGSFIKYRYKVIGVKRANDDGAASLDVVRTMSLLAFSGIGKHEAFLAGLSKNKFVSVSDLRFPDHHRYTEEDIAMLASFGTAMRVDACITTEKDVVRLRANGELAKKLFDEVPVFYLQIEVDVLEGKDELLSRIENLLTGEFHNGHWHN